VQVDYKGKSRHRILAGIRKAKRIARVDLARETGISAATVTTITSDLIDVGLIEETPRELSGEDQKRGRPRVDLKIRGKSHLIAGMKVSDHGISSVITNFEGAVISEHEYLMPNQSYAPSDLTEHINTALGQVAMKAGVNISGLSGLGIGIAGIIDGKNGLAYWSPSLNERNVPLRQMISDKTGLNVFLDNDANLVAMAEQYFGHGRTARDFIVVTVESGVGMGIVLNNEIYRGTRGCGAEFGHTKVHLDGALCRCGQRGCLEAYVADYALLREASVGSVLGEASDTAARLQTLLDAARAGERTAEMIISRAGRMFAMGLANIVNIFDPQLIIISGARMQSDFLYADDVIKMMHSSIVQVDVAPPEVVIHKWGDTMWAMGAAAYAIEGVSNTALRKVAQIAS